MDYGRRWAVATKPGKRAKGVRGALSFDENRRKVAGAYERAREQGSPEDSV